MLRRTVKTLLWVIAACIVLAAGIVLSLQFPAVQSVIVQKAAAFLSEKSGRRIDIGTVDIAFTHSLVLGNIFIAEGEKDTLLFVRTIAVDVNLLGLLSNEIIMKNIRIDSLTAHISRRLLDPVTLRADSSYNFSDILSALSAEPSASPAPIDTTGSSPWKIRIDEFHLSNIAATYDDDVSGMNAVIRLGSLHVSIDRFDLDRLKFHLQDISLTNTSAVITQFKSSDGSLPDTSAPSEFDIGFSDISASNIQFLYRNTVTNEQYFGDIGTVSIAADKFDILNRRLILKNILLENSGVSIVVSPTDPSRKKLPDTSGAPWVIGLSKMLLVNNSMQYDVHGAKRMTGLDLNHVRLEALTMDMKNIFFSDERIAAEISHMSFHERSGFVLRELSGNAVIDSSRAQLSNFTVETPASRIHQNTLLTFSKRSDRTDFSGNIGVRMVMDDSYIAASDILFFQPSLPLNGHSNTRFAISTDISGRLDSLNVAGLQISTADSTLLDLSGTVQGLPDTDRMYIDMVLHQFSTVPADLRTNVIDSLLPQTISVPAMLTVSGRFKGTLNDFSATAAIASSFGSVDIRAGMNGGRDSRSARWNTQFNIRKFDLGSLLSDSSLFGPVTLNASAAGKGSSMDDLSASVNVVVHEATVNGYAYKDLTVKGTATPTMFDGTAEIRDSNIVFTFRGLIDVGNVHPAARFTL
ncbi:MAG: AsmA family protein, partial [Bacteroidetes bacterium]|nr:AsmA family protein [Bacteroidota bacterium]